MKTLSSGSIGREVTILQTGLNLLPSALAQLAVDGIFGSKTYNRAKEYQDLARIIVDGIVGQQTWTTMELILGLIERIVEQNRLRDKVVSVANQEATGLGMTVHAKMPGTLDASKNKYFRAGYVRLLEYFRKAAPDPKKHGKTLFNEDNITYLSKPFQLPPCPHWCGIFALWAHKEANIQVGTWKLGRGIFSVQGFHPTQNPRKADIGYVGGKYQHMVLIERVYLLNNQIMIDTIEGNSEPDSAIKKKQRPKIQIQGFLSAF
ncbi:MAG: peptidoglycan-binding protein [Desulfobacula sp.]|uniref:peptidoglycan-binding domain-containing protein n=1 Tax=Desulfobacula sp. TaxID=2593537 RepID=UPI0025BE07A7|nr:peptidoglycan-binding domain-containing protein [Desulfobacula sp.]MCD4722915.1 peptidoglycan-binding protein [Desulfobacula sp.]